MNVAVLDHRQSSSPRLAHLTPLSQETTTDRGDTSPALWAAYHAHPNAELRSQLIEQYAPLAKYVVDRMNLQPSGGISYDDLISQAIIGMITAIDRYDPSRGVKFNTFAYYRIRGAVIDMLRELDWVPRSLRSKANDILNTTMRLETELGRVPTDVEVADALGITPDKFSELVQEVGGQTIVSLDETLDADSSESNYSLGDQIADDEIISPAQFTETEDRRRILAETISELPEKEQLVISLYYTDGLTLKEISRMLGVTESRVCQLHSKAILRLRSMMQATFA
jgi:RNA polymerase sigma factor for flagellar operon FliA